ncbi:MAG: hypothetical protein JJU00_11935 [Opitutales bacterium]|nr:hypothetical protein [Opitutales bacterium]
MANMICAHFKFDGDVTQDLLREFARHGIQADSASAGYSLTRGRTKVSFSVERNDEGVYIVQVFSTCFYPFSRSNALAKDVSSIIAGYGGEGTDMLENMLPPRKRRTVRTLHMVSAVSLLCFAAIGLYSHLTHGSAEHIFKESALWTVVGLVLALGVLGGQFGVPLLVGTHKKDDQKKSGGAG